MGEKYARGYKLNVYPELADTLQEEDYNSIFGMSSFNGVMEAEDVASVGLKTVAGKSKCESLSQIIISDFAAYTLCKRGYIGYGKDGKYSVLQPVDFESLVGTKLSECSKPTMKNIGRQSWKWRDSTQKRRRFSALTKHICIAKYSRRLALRSNTARIPSSVT